MKKQVLFGCLAVLLILATGGCGMGKGAGPAPLTAEDRVKLDRLMGEAGPPANVAINDLPVMTPDVLRIAFEENPLNAERMYEDTWIKLRGNIVAGPVKTNTGGVSHYMVTLAHKNKRVACVFLGKAKEAQLLELRSGQELVVVGRYTSTARGPFLYMCSMAD